MKKLNAIKVGFMTEAWVHKPEDKINVLGGKVTLGGDVVPASSDNENKTFLIQRSKGMVDYYVEFTPGVKGNTSSSFMINKRGVEIVKVLLEKLGYTGKMIGNNL